MLHKFGCYESQEKFDQGSLINNNNIMVFSNS